MSGRRNSKRNSTSVESEPASKRHKPDDSSIISATNGDNNDERAEPRAPSFDEDAMAKLPGKERSCLVDLPYPDQVQRHVRWRESGREHDTFCFVCEQPDDLIFCYTCRRSYHPACMSSPHDFPGEEWWCPVCVLRGWDKWTPETTLISPIPPCDDIEDSRSTHVHDITKTQVKEDKDNTTQPPERQAHYYAATSNHKAPPVQPIAPAVRSGPPPISHREPPSENREQSMKQRSQPRARKSRYSNFLPEVDSAISIIYRELESTADLRSQLVDTQTEVRTLSQELRIRDNQLLLANKMSASKQALEAEVTNLKAELASKRSSSGEVEHLKEGYARLEAEVRELRSQLQQKDKEKDEWRDKLRRLIEPGAT